MTSEFDMSTVKIPYGVLHDSELTGVSCENNSMIFSFKFDIYPEDYTDDFYKQYESFKHCDMIVEMNEEPFNYFRLETCMNNSGKFQGLCLNREDFLNVINNASNVTFVECAVSYREFTVELCVDYYHAKGKYKKYKKYHMCYITLDAAKVKWKWY